MLKVKQIDVGSVQRWRVPPAFDFVEAAIENGDAYQIGERGYALIGGQESLLPGFIVELKLEEARIARDSRLIIRALQEIGSGAIWFDSLDHQAFELVWRARLAAQGSSILFGSSEPAVPHRFGSSIQLRTVNNDQCSATCRIFSDMRRELGGQTEDEIIGLLNAGKIIGGFRGDKLLCGAIVLPQDEHWVSVAAVSVAPEYRHRQIGPRFMNALLHELQKNRKVVGGVGQHNIFAHKTLLRLGMRPIRHSWTSILDLSP
jgi:GNAT superfamily N-acetyltransferase